MCLEQQLQLPVLGSGIYLGCWEQKAVQGSVLCKAALHTLFNFFMIQNFNKMRHALPFLTEAAKSTLGLPCLTACGRIIKKSLFWGYI